MQTAEVVLSAIRKRGTEGRPLQRVYRQLFNRHLYLLAYGRIYRNAGQQPQDQMRKLWMVCRSNALRR